MKYLTFDVLTGFAPDRSSGLSGTQSSRLSVAASKFGARHVYDRRGVPTTSRSYSLYAEGAQAIYTLRQFLDARKGRVVPFWFSSQRADLVIHHNAAAGANTLVIKATRYTALQFPYKARRHLDLGQGQFVQVIAAQDNGDGTETLRLSSNLTQPVSAGQSVSFLTFCRLGSDDYTLAYPHINLAEASIEVVELPNETP